MTLHIKRLPDELITRIAAGEVVERPASVVKELVENSLDAGATEITLHIEGAGRSKISVADNGSGMNAEEARLAFERHATSKISRFDDLEQLKTYGFRGEALPSIASVSHVRLLTRTRESEAGSLLELKGGQRVLEKPAARENGTTITVERLFFNTPARFKFLKSDSTERGQCLRVMEEIVFASPEVAFHLHVENAKPLHFQARRARAPEEKFQILRLRVRDAWGPKWAEGFEPFEKQSLHFYVRGGLTHPDFHQSTPRFQRLFINGRPVSNRRLTRALYDSYTGRLPVGRHPGWVVFLEVDPRGVDVNVHPSKREVKLTHEAEIFSFIRNAAGEAFASIRRVPGYVFARGSMEPPSSSSARPYQPAVTLPAREALSSPADHKVLKEAINTLYAPLRQEDFSSLRPEPLGPGRALAQLKKTYILAEDEAGLSLVDQHAAAERFLYENLRGCFNAERQSQKLLIPFSWEVSLSLIPAVKNSLEKLLELGFEIDYFGGNTFVVKSYPRLLGEKFDLHSLLDGMSDLLLEPKDARGGLERDFAHQLAALTACKAAVRAGERLSVQECQKILDDLQRCEGLLTCPHGRPTTIKLSKSELDRRFRRT